MAKKVIIQDKKNSVVYPYPSRYGSHKSMIVSENGDGTVVCKDECGEYITYATILDNGLADPHRFNGDRVRYEKSK